MVASIHHPWPELLWLGSIAEVGAEHLAEPALEPCREDSPEITSPVVPFATFHVVSRRFTSVHVVVFGKNQTGVYVYIYIYRNR